MFSQGRFEHCRVHGLGKMGVGELPGDHKCKSMVVTEGFVERRWKSALNSLLPKDGGSYAAVWLHRDSVSLGNLPNLVLLHPPERFLWLVVLSGRAKCAQEHSQCLVNLVVFDKSASALKTLPDGPKRK